MLNRDGVQLADRRSTSGDHSVVLTVLRVALITVMLVIVLLPFLLTLAVALKPINELVTQQFTLTGWTLDNFARAWSGSNMSKFTVTTMVYAILGTVLSTGAAAMAAYAFARLKFRGRGVLFSIVLATLMVPYAILVLPLFAVMLHVPLAGGNDIFGQGGIGLYNSMLGLIVPSIFDAVSIFLLVQFFRSIPLELSDAARIDGASEWRILSRVILPLSVPGLATVAILQFAQLWNAYLWPLVMSSSDDLYTVTVGLSQLKSVAGSVGGSAPTSNALAPEVLAGSILAVIPVFVVFVAGQRYFRRGIALSGMK